MKVLLIQTLRSICVCCNKVFIEEIWKKLVIDKIPLGFKN
ncbi:hypothetical protein RUMHYD_00330 [Blautia hydrogenotrophica DSM 10507]|uniref:Uncharacterized protein n=1 Tax=Blautia hydrogenotrophica (strain DSM 10507 / JCM 14656 / S5a33) TaxID=476272 RepID=C0CHL6_BLAHS|nr:hypothetical protein RUMHYD_00330 [Blautia hydrogenotrophica DSM 10507]